MQRIALGVLVLMGAFAWSDGHPRESLASATRAAPHRHRREALPTADNAFFTVWRSEVAHVAIPSVLYGETPFTFGADSDGQATRGTAMDPSQYRIAISFHSSPAGQRRFMLG